MLIENGILKGYLQDKQNARLMGVSLTGNGRRESYAALPMPRMTNTYMLADQYDPAEIIASVKKGIYAPTSVAARWTSPPASSSSRLRGPPHRGWQDHCAHQGATLIGNGPEAMSQVSMVGRDLALDRGVGVCGKEGQSVPVGVGQPTLKLDQLTVGGTQ